jgi:recombinational DNA repair protein (RecF pathway)
MSSIITEVTTSSLILSQSDLGEADVYLDILTTEVGRVPVRARGVRRLRSKLRYSLEPYSLGQANLIQSKTGGWLLITSTMERNLFYEPGNSESRHVITRMMDLIRRVTPPEEPCPSLVRFLMDVTNNYDYVIKNYLLYASLLLSDLGYFDLSGLTNPGIFDEWLSNSKSSFPNVMLAPDEIHQLKHSIARALHNSQL